MARSNGRPEAARERWRRRIDRWERSGLSAREFCRRAGVSQWSFYHWRRALDGNGRAHVAASSGQGRQAKARRPRPMASTSPFVPIQVVPQAAEIRGGVLEVLLRGGHVLRVAGPCDPAALGALARALADA